MFVIIGAQDWPVWSITSENGRTIDLAGYHGRVKGMTRPSASETEKLMISVLARTIGRATSEMANNMISPRLVFVADVTPQT